MGGEATKKIDQETLWGGGRSPFSTSYGKQMMWFFLVSDALTFGGLLVAYGYTRHAFTGAWPLCEQVFWHFPFAGHKALPLLYVAMMTFILIISSVTMVLAVEAGHRMDKKGVIKWLTATVIGGFVFVGSQAWEWKTFICGPDGKYGTRTLEIVGASEDGKGFIAQEVDEKEEESTHHTGHSSHDTHGAEHAEEGHGHEIFVAKDGFHSKYGIWDTKEIGIGSKVTYKDDATLWQNYYGYQDIYEGGHSGEGFDFHHAAAYAKPGPTQYGQFFFFITGFHGFHVFSGVIINLIVLIMVLRGVFHRRGHYEMVEKVGLYWHFVDLVWVFVFTFFYLV